MLKIQPLRLRPRVKRIKCWKSFFVTSKKQLRAIYYGSWYLFMSMFSVELYCISFWTFRYMPMILFLIWLYIASVLCCFLSNWNRWRAAVKLKSSAELKLVFHFMLPPVFLSFASSTYSIILVFVCNWQYDLAYASSDLFWVWRLPG